MFFRRLVRCLFFEEVNMNANDIKAFVTDYKKILSTGVATELSYRSTFEFLFKQGTHIIPINDPKVTNHNKPDFTFVLDTNLDFIVGYAEMKDVGVNLDEIVKTNQWNRYKSLTNIFLTDGFQWRFYKNGVEYTRIEIAEFDPTSKKVKAKNDYFESLANQLNYFFDNSTEKITSGQKLSEIMGNRARLIRDNILRQVVNGEIENEDINGIFMMFKELLVSDLSIDAFADMYAQTLIYGLFIARYNDSTPDNFDRREARELIPSTNPLLRDFFDHIAGASFDETLQPIVDNICQLFCVTDVKTIVKRHVNSDDNDYRDPIIHFYEDFLQSYDPELKKKMGAYYTPTPVVKYIIEAVDSALKNEFGIVDGISSSETVPYTYRVDEGYKIGKGTGSKTYFEKTIDIPKVQILDPAVGTATFLNETIRYIYKQKFTNQQGMWDSYVNSNLIRRLNGFEIMMTPYTIAHLKLGMTLQSMGATIEKQRLRVFLTNTLTEGIKNDLPLLQLFGLTKAVTKESEMAAEVKNDYPVMVVIGNPPYSVSSNNKSKYIEGLLNDYKKGLNEKNIQPLSDDYIKFIRFAENMTERNGKGIVAMITNNSYLDGIIHREMRHHLLNTFDKIYVVNLHGNSRKKETAPNGSKDENVFDIMQGVSIAIMIKTKKTSTNCEVYYTDLFGLRSDKFEALHNNSFVFSKLSIKSPEYYFVPKDYGLQDEYYKYISLDDLFITNTTGITSSHDNELISFLPFDTNCNQKITYRPFDTRYIDYDLNKVVRPRYSVMKHMIEKDNLSIIYTRINRKISHNYSFVSRFATDRHLLDSAGDSAKQAPLYIYDDNGNKSPNFDSKCWELLLKKVGPQSPEDTLDYIYAILHSPSYQIKFKDYLGVACPRIPIPTKESFNRLVPLGKELRELHLMLNPIETIVAFPKNGNCIVDKIEFVNGKVSINDDQYFENISESAWNTFIGGYQPAQKWLKDRKGRQLSFEDVVHYEQIIAILERTNEIMDEIG